MNKLSRPNPRSFVLMAALPPTLGHADLIKFARNLGDDALVIVVTRGEEPYIKERVQALQEHFRHEETVKIDHLHLDYLFAEGNPYWAETLTDYGFQPGDFLVASEPWGEEIAEMLGGEFYPYDVDREIRYTKATTIRNDLGGSWHWIIPEFQRLLQKRIVIVGGKASGKTTLMRGLRDSIPGTVGVFHYEKTLLALRNVDFTPAILSNVYRGQKAIQLTVEQISPVPRTVVLDTDLWFVLKQWEDCGLEPPKELLADAKNFTADLYLLLTGATDDTKTWRKFLERNQLPFLELEVTEFKNRLERVHGIVEKLIAGELSYERQDLDQ